MNHIKFVQGLNNTRVLPLDAMKVENDFGCFRTLWLYGSELKDYYDKNNSLENFRGVHKTDLLFFDFDGDDLGKVRESTKAFVSYLINAYDIEEEFISIYFSGNKGFHVTLPFEMVGEDIEPSKDFYLKYEALVKKITDGFDYVDLSIYNPLRLIRIPNTKHEKSKLYKVPLTKYELDDEEFLIKFNAKKPRGSIVADTWDSEEYFGQANLMEEWSTVKDTTFPEGNEHKNGKISEPNSFINAIESTTGGRHEKLTKILGYLIDKGVGIDNGMAIAKNWNMNLETPMDAKRLEKDVKGIYKSFWDRRPKEVKEEVKSQVATTTDFDISNIIVYGDKYQDQFLDHISRLSKGGRIGTGYKMIDNPIRGMIAGEVMTIVGKTAVGKSAFVHNILLNNVAMGRRVLFFSLEMPLPAVAERTLQRMLGKSGEHIEESFLKGDMNIETDALQAFQKLENFVTIPKQGINYQEIEQYITATEEYFGEKFDIVAIDYAGLIKIEGDSLYAQQSEISRDMKALSGRTQTSVITLAQVSKQYGENDVIDLDATRDSGVVTEASDYVVGLWRSPVEGDQVINLHGNVCKNRNGRAVQFNMEMNRTTLKFALDKFEDFKNNNGELF